MHYSRYRKIFAGFLIFCLSIFNGMASLANNQIIEVDAEKINYNKPDPGPSIQQYLLPIPAILGVNFICWEYSKAFTNESWVNISWKTVKENISHGYVFDVDEFSTNQFGHPYQGGVYYSCARSAGLGFWPSSLYALFGSWQWETFMENEYPSLNDLLTTSVGGSALGEVSYRLSNYFLDDSSHGLERILREFIGLAINPAHGFERLFSGKMWKDGPPPILPILAGEMVFGSSFSIKKIDIAKRIYIARLIIEYGYDSILLPEKFEPFDYFSLEVSSMLVETKLKGRNMTLTGLTNGWKFSWQNADNAVFGLVVDFDYFNNIDFDLGASGVGATVISTFPIRKDLCLYFRTMLLCEFGAITAEHTDGEDRHYNFGAGLASELWMQLVYKRGKVYMKCRRYWLKTVSGTAGNEIAGIFYLGTAFNITGPFTIGGRFHITDKFGNYSNFPDRTKLALGGEAYLSISF